MMIMKCLVCNSRKNTVFDTNQLDGFEKHLRHPPKGVDILKCLKCGLFFFNPLPSKEQLKSYHGEQYFVHSDPSKQTGYSNYIESEHLLVKKEWGEKIFSWFSSFDNISDGTQRKVIDVGCAVGAMLYGMAFRSVIRRAVGVDISEWAIEWGKKHFSGIELYCGRLPEVALQSKAEFDYVLFWDSLEHDNDIHEVLDSVYDITRCGGLIMIQTPDGAFAKPDWYYWSPHQHTCIFNEHNLSLLLRQHGFNVIKKRLSSEPEELILLARKE